MEELPSEITQHIHEYRPVHPTARIWAEFCHVMQFRYTEDGDENIIFVANDLRSEPDYFEGPLGRRLCVRPFYRWQGEFDPRFHGGRR